MVELPVIGHAVHSFSRHLAMRRKPMEKKRPDLVELRQQRELIRRITVGALVIALAFVLVSCQGLTSRDAQALTEASPSQNRAQGPRGRLGLSGSLGGALWPAAAGQAEPRPRPRLSYESQAASPTDEPHGRS